jgi:hypothetical protein
MLKEVLLRVQLSENLRRNFSVHSLAFTRTVKAPALGRGSSVSIVNGLRVRLPTKHGSMPGVGQILISSPKRL